MVDAFLETQNYMGIMNKTFSINKASSKIIWYPTLDIKNKNRTFQCKRAFEPKDFEFITQAMSHDFVYATILLCNN